MSFAAKNSVGQEKSDYRLNTNPDLVRTLSSAHGKVKGLAQEGARAMSKRKFNDARNIYQKMVEMAPENSLAYANLGVAEFQLKNYDAAELSITKSLELNPSIGHNWTTLGIIQFRKNELYLAISSLTRSIHEDPNNSQAYLHLAAVSYQKGWVHAAIENLSRVVELQPKNADAQYNLALTYCALSHPKLELAKRHYYNAIDLGFPKSEIFEKRLAELSQ